MIFQSTPSLNQAILDPNERELKEFVTNLSALQKMLKEILQDDKKLY